MTSPCYLEFFSLKPWREKLLVETQEHEPRKQRPRATLSSTRSMACFETAVLAPRHSIGSELLSQPAPGNPGRR